MRETFSFCVNGLDVRASFDTDARDGIFLPLLERLTELYHKSSRRVVAFLAAPPGAGKSTLGCYLEALSRRHDGLAALQCVGLDGFHLPNAVLDARTIDVGGACVPLRSIKGAPETFDADALKRCLDSSREDGQRWPVYDRRLHDPVPDAVAITGEILLVEGNWLLLDEEPWRALSCDLTIFIRAEADELTSRLIRRKTAGGLDEAAAREFVLRSDMNNIRRCLDRARRADVELGVRDGRWEVISK